MSICLYPAWSPVNSQVNALACSLGRVPAHEPSAKRELLLLGSYSSVESKKTYRYTAYLLCYSTAVTSFGQYRSMSKFCEYCEVRSSHARSTVMRLTNGYLYNREDDIIPEHRLIAYISKTLGTVTGGNRVVARRLSS